MGKRIHCQEELEKDIKFLENIELRWSNAGYSTSKHLFVLRGILEGLGAKRIGEIGFGRSSIVLALYAKRNGAEFITCDRYDYRKFFPFDSKFIVGYSDKFYKEVKKGLDFMFMDYLSTRKMNTRDCYREIKRAFKLIKQNGIIGIHDTIEDRYNAKEAVKIFKKKYLGKAEVFTFPYGFGLTIIKRLVMSDFGKVKSISYKRKEK